MMDFTTSFKLLKFYHIGTFKIYANSLLLPIVELGFTGFYLVYDALDASI